MTSGNKPLAHRRAVGPPKDYDILGALQFMLLVNLGLRDNHILLDIGCGSLRAGKLFIPYLNCGNYVGIEPNQALVHAGIQEEMGHTEVLARGAITVGPKGSTFWDISDFDLTYTSVRPDYILAHSIFTHAPKLMIEKCLAEACKIMHDKSIFAFTYKVGSDFSGNKFESGPGTIMATYTTPTIMTMVHEAGLFASHINWPHPYGQRWVVVVKKRSNFPSFKFCDVVVMHHIQNGG